MRAAEQLRVLVELDPGPADVAGEEPFGIDTVLPLDRVQDQPVLMVDDSAAVRPAQGYLGLIGTDVSSEHGVIFLAENQDAFAGHHVPHQDAAR